MTQTPAPTPPDTTLDILDRQLVMLKELGEIGMVVARAQAHAAVAAAHAVEVILADEFWQPESGRALALAGNRHAADAYQTVTRALRLTLMLEKATALTARDLRAGVAPRAAGDARAIQAVLGASLDEEPGRRPTVESREEIRPDREGLRAERGERERPERLPTGGFRVTVNGLCEEVGAEADWAAWSIHRRPLDYQPLEATPPGWGAGPPPPDYRPGRAPIPHPRHGGISNPPATALPVPAEVEAVVSD